MRRDVIVCDYCTDEAEHKCKKCNKDFCEGCWINEHSCVDTLLLELEG